MRVKKILVGAGAVLAAMAMTAPSASAVPLCAGTDRTIVLCVDPTAGTLYEDCIYAGEPPCRPVSVPGPTASCGGDIGDMLALCSKMG